MIYKWLVTFTTPASKGKFLKETVEATDWFHRLKNATKVAPIATPKNVAKKQRKKR